MKININARNEFIRFSVAGSIVTATDFSIYFVLFHFLSFNVSKGISCTCAGIVGYLLYKYWTFKKDRASFTEICRYTFINILAIGINVSVNHHFLRVWPEGIFIALMIATATTSVFTFISFKWWVFRPYAIEKRHFLWWKWLPWKYLVRKAALAQGFLDPIKLLSQLQNFAQPSEVAAPTELIRSGVVLHARGLMNSLAIQHNLDWVWPYWVECQYDPCNKAFIPRSFC